jgi:hypothetical protein
MQTFWLWEGERTYAGGFEDADYEVVVFNGEEIGTWGDLFYDLNSRSVTIRVFKTEENTIVFHRFECVRREDGEEQYSYVYEYPDFETAADAGWRKVLEDIRAIPRRSLTLREWRAQRRK